MAQYNIQETEKKLIEFWDKEGIYKFDSNAKKIFSIDTPPPTVSGKMHIGHAFQYSQMDFIARFKRMNGFSIFYPFGTDDNGLPTERLIEKEKKVKAFSLGREQFIKLVLETLDKELRPKYLEDWKRVGMSCDWTLFYSTINEHCRRIAQWSFLDLHKKGRMERRDAPAMWCPECRTGVSQIEIKDKELDSMFNDIVFKVKEKNGEREIIIATTRPELLPACVAVFVYPDDKRYKELVGKKAKVPLFDFEVPILEDKRADPEKGTGIVMCCTFGDQTDMEWQKAHKLPIKEAITKDGKMSHLAGKYKGMTMKEARKQMIEDMRSVGLLKNQKSIKHFVNVHERCDTEIEFIKTKQWFVRYLDLRKDMLKWGAKLKWHPKFMKSRYDNWVKGLQWDWLISNQRYYGVPFPVWYCEKCDKVYLADENKLPVDPLKDSPPREKCECGGKLVGETDIFNTWFTSSLTPTIAAKLRPEIEEKVKFMDLRPQAHDIITFWLFNTVVKSNIHYGKNPWKNVMISGFVTLEGQKMSKSKGNVVEPQAVTEQHGADALRFWAAGSKLGEDLDYQEKDILTGKKFITKLFNASNFVFMNLADYKNKKPAQIEKIDSLFLEELNGLIKTATSAFEEYEYSRAKTEVEKFFWHEFCDNYLEIVKKRIYNNKKGKESAQYILYHSLLALLKIIAPIMPFITEEIYQEHYRQTEKEKSIHISQWPKTEKIETEKKEKKTKKVEGKKVKEGDKKELDEWGLFTDILAKIRQEKTKMQKAMNCEIVLKLEKEHMKKLDGLLEDLKDVMNIKDIKEGKFKVEF